jgi:hypothetical protein
MQRKLIPVVLDLVQPWNPDGIVRERFSIGRCVLPFVLSIVALVLSSEGPGMPSEALRNAIEWSTGAKPNKPRWRSFGRGRGRIALPPPRVTVRTRGHRRAAVPGLVRERKAWGKLDI